MQNHALSSLAEIKGRCWPTDQGQKLAFIVCLRMLHLSNSYAHAFHLICMCYCYKLLKRLLRQLISLPSNKGRGTDFFFLLPEHHMGGNIVNEQLAV